MLYVGIDVAKDKHDCAIVDDRGNTIVRFLRIKNSLEGFTKLIQRIDSITPDRSEVEIGLEDTGHYSGNISRYLSNLFTVKTINPLLTAKQKKAETLRKTKTDKIDAVEIAKMLRNGNGFKPVVSIAYDREELKSLTRYRDTLVKKRSIEKTSVKRLVNILFPELEQFFKDVHRPTVYGVLSEYPGRKYLAVCRTPALAKVLRSASKGHYGEDMAMRLRESAKSSIGRDSEAMSYELQRTIARIRSLSREINELDDRISEIVLKANPPILSIPGIGPTFAATIIGEVGDFSLFSSAEKLLAFAGMSPTMYQSGKYTSSHCKMEKRGSKTLRKTLYLATRAVCLFDPTFGDYLLKKRNEGKHYFVAISHASKKLVRLMYKLETQHCSYEPQLAR